jgi:hypothetical protein
MRLNPSVSTRAGLQGAQVFSCHHLPYSAKPYKYLQCQIMKRALNTSDKSGGGMEVFVRIVLGILILFSFLGAVDDWWRSPTLLALPVLGAVCWVLASRIAAQEKKIRELENLLRAKSSEASNA